MGNTNDSNLEEESQFETNAVVKVGWLLKQGAVKKNWNKRYCVLLSCQKLLYFTDSNCIEYNNQFYKI